MHRWGAGRAGRASSVCSLWECGAVASRVGRAGMESAPPATARSGGPRRGSRRGARGLDSSPLDMLAVRGKPCSAALLPRPPLCSSIVTTQGCRARRSGSAAQPAPAAPSRVHLTLSAAVAFAASQQRRVCGAFVDECAAGDRAVGRCFLSGGLPGRRSDPALSGEGLVPPFLGECHLIERVAPHLSTLACRCACAYGVNPAASRAGEKHQSASPFAHPLVWCCWEGVA